MKSRLGLAACSALFVLAVSGTAFAQTYADYGTPVNPQFKLELVSDPNEPLMKGKSVTVTNNDGTMTVGGLDFWPLVDAGNPVGFTGDGSIDYLAYNFDHKTDVTLSSQGIFSSTHFSENLQVGKAYLNATSDTGSTIPEIAFTFGSESCNQVGQFTINTLQAEYKDFGIGHHLWASHVLAVDMVFVVQCSGTAPAVHGHLSYSDTGKGGVQSPGSGGGGGNGGGGTGGTPTPAPPPTTPIVTFSDGFFDAPVALGNAQSVEVPFSIFVPDGFNNDVTVSASGSSDGLDFSFDHTTFPAPGSGNGVLTISAGPDTFPIDRQVAITATFNDANGLPVSSTTTFTVSLFCDPPMILGLDQPKNATVPGGSSANLSVTPTGSEPFTYQWYAGSTGQTNFPVSNATSQTFTTPAVTTETPFWVRISNACGSADSSTVVVTPK